MRPFAENRESMKLLQNKFMDSIDTDLLSLSDLWGDNREKGDREGVKLEEERLKREHCEAMIQQLQRKILEQQEKLAVAVKVDKAKDAAIAKLQEKQREEIKLYRLQLAQASEKIGLLEVKFI
ncbi:hypothetical protein O3G_MSEX015342 [Manduca sexta]|uniref:Uncharacterized protein n=1 Tax=Manduca sexta TaxID=7130 RepID=A0A922A1S0_MANSE|nr:hypothetical protein O3G_MSEX015342 [Manduca sexta]